MLHEAYSAHFVQPSPGQMTVITCCAQHHMCLIHAWLFTLQAASIEHEQPQCFAAACMCTCTDVCTHLMCGSLQHCIQCRDVSGAAGLAHTRQKLSAALRPYTPSVSAILVTVVRSAKDRVAGSAKGHADRLQRSWWYTQMGSAIGYLQHHLLHSTSEEHAQPRLAVCRSPMSLT